jgi:hypothetical protein
MKDNGWTPGLPQEPGDYWFHGKPYGPHGRTRTILIKTARNAKCGLIHSSESTFLFKGEAEGWHQPAIIPEPPEEQE